MPQRKASRQPKAKAALESPLALGSGTKLFDLPSRVSLDDPVPPSSVWVNYLREKINRAPSNWALLLRPASSSHFRASLAALRILTESGYEGVYLSLNHPYTALQEEFKNAGITPGSVCIADAVSMQAGGAQIDSEKLVYVDSPADLTGITIAIDAMLPVLASDKKFLLVDSLAPLVEHHSVAGTAKFARFLVDKMRVSDVNSALVWSGKGSGKEQDELGQLLDPLFDETIDLP